ncbi:hypothetical protein MKX01_001154 [Papaver californicum]|nr:hypothetical protein MKX01_001154 [Papaver californicum]
MIFTIASRYVSKPVSCVSTLFTILHVSKHLLITFLYALPLMIGAYVANFSYLYLIDAIPKMNDVIAIISVIIHGSVVTMKRSRQLSRGKTSIAFILVVLYLIAATAILLVTNLVMILLVAFCVIIMTGVNFLGLIGQSALYYACKSYHNEAIDKEVLYAHLDGKNLVTITALMVITWKLKEWV